MPPPPEHNTRPPSLIYGGLILGTLAITFVAERYFRLNPQGMIPFLVGITFLFGAFKTPEALFQTLRSLGWFSSIRDDDTMRVILFVFGVISTVLGFLFLQVPLPPRY